jgi:signal recognition particle receptor subunit alpha
MLDLFTVLTSGGIVLFQRSQASSNGSSSSTSLSAPTYLIDKLISDVFMQERSSEKEYARDGYSVKWTFANELGLIFVAVYQKILELSWVEDLLVAVKRMFVKMYSDTLKRGDAAAVINDLNNVECHFGNWFDGKVKVYEGAKVPRLPRRDETKGGK